MERLNNSSELYYEYRAVLATPRQHDSQKISDPYRSEALRSVNNGAFITRL